MFFFRNIAAAESENEILCMNDKKATQQSYISKKVVKMMNVNIFFEYSFNRCE